MLRKALEGFPYLARDSNRTLFNLITYLCDNIDTFAHFLHSYQISIIAVSYKPIGILKEKSYNFHNYKFF